MVEGSAVMTEAVANQKSIPLTFALCPDHRRTAELAEQLVDQSNHPAYRYQVGCALDALSFVAPATVDHMAYLDPEGLAAPIRRLGHLGATARWISRFVPVMTPRPTPGRAPGTPSRT